MPMSASLQRRAVVDAVAGHGHDVAAGLQGPGDAQLVLGRRPGRRRRRRGRAARRARASSCGQVLAVERRARRRPSRPTSAAIARAVAGWSPVTIATRMPACRQRGDRRGRARAGRVLEADEAEQLELVFGHRRLGVVRDAPQQARRGDGEHPQARDSAIASSASSAPAVGRQRGRSTASGAPLTNSRSPTTTDMRRRRGSNGKRRRTGCGGFVGGDVDAEPAGEGVERRLHRVAVGDPATVLLRRPDRSSTERRPARAVAASAHDGAGQRRAPRSGRSRRRRSCAVPAGVHTSTTVISLRVRVPVLSVQMNVVEPSVSTASRRRTRAWRPAIRCAPTPATA